MLRAPLRVRHRSAEGVDAPAQVLYFGDNRLDLRNDLLEHRLSALGVGCDLGLDQLETDPQRDQPLLGAVVKVALNLAPGLIRGRGDPGARRIDLGQRSPQLRGQPFVVEERSDRRTHPVDQRRLFADGAITRDLRLDLAVNLDGTEGAPRARLRLGRSALNVKPPALVLV